MAKTIDDKFSTAVKRITDFFTIPNIAHFDAAIKPNFDDPKNPVYADIVLTPLGDRTEAAIEDMILYINESIGKGFRTNTTARKLYDSRANKYHLIIIPDARIPRAEWVDETNQFLSHMPHFLDDYGKKYKHRKPYSK